VALTVFAEGMGLFHKGSGGKAVAPGDVCLTPPPPPTGPVPVPYVNNVSASDLAKGSKSVKIDGEATALEDQSEVSTSVGDEPGTQGGNVVTHKTKGKGYFAVWSHTVKIEGKGVCRHGDQMGQAAASTPYGVVDMAAVTSFHAAHGSSKPCPPYPSPRPSAWGPTPSQSAAQSAKGEACWRAPCTGQATVADHQPPLVVAWVMGGCHMKPADFTKWASSQAAVPRGHCSRHSRSQGGHMSQQFKALESAKAMGKLLAALV